MYLHQLIKNMFSALQLSPTTVCLLKQAFGTFDVCLARPKDCPTDIVRPLAAQLVVDWTVDQFCLYGLVRIGP